MKMQEGMIMKEIKNRRKDMKRKLRITDKIVYDVCKEAFRFTMNDMENIIKVRNEIFNPEVDKTMKVDTAFRDAVMIVMKEKVEKILEKNYLEPYPHDDTLCGDGIIRVPWRTYMKRIILDMVDENIQSNK